MSVKKEFTKKKILDAAVVLLESTENPEDITVRKIAETAGVGVGLINYYYESRDQLIHEAVSLKMKAMALSTELREDHPQDPVLSLKEFLTNMSDIGMKDKKLSKISAQFELLSGNFSTCLYLLPMLRRIYNGKKSETDLRLIAYQIIVVTQSIYLRQHDFHMYSGINIDDKRERDALISFIIDNLII